MRDDLNECNAPLLSSCFGLFPYMQAKDIFPVLDKAWKAFTASVTDNTTTAERLAGLTEASFSRPAPFKERVAAQQESLKLPVLPTTTIGSFPQVRHADRMLSKRRWDMMHDRRKPFCETTYSSSHRQKCCRRGLYVIR